MAVFVAKVQPGHHPRLFAATIVHGPIPPSVEPIWSSYIADPRTGYCAEDQPSHPIFRERSFCVVGAIKEVQTALHISYNCKGE